ncbi:MAG: glucose-6-phosphate dehydrogenase [Actinomycetia bacterium]|nr:glucose-6-phosphate dehydrogenase [Actinomycetes bacterium]
MTDTPQTFVILGANGDLTERLLLPGIASYLATGAVDQPLKIIGSGRHANDEFPQTVREAFAQTLGADPLPGPVLEDTAQQAEFRVSDATDPEDLAGLIERERGPVVLYFALAPAVAVDTVDALARLKEQGRLPQRLILAMEKPLGTGEDSARELDAKLADLVPEEDVYRVDHFLGMPGLLSLLGLRFGNRLFESAWSREGIESIDILFEETLGLEGRADFYDGTGAAEDMLQSHLLQVMGLTLMDPQGDIDGVAIQEASAEIICSARVAQSAADGEGPAVVRGRYTAGEAGGKSLPSYVDEDGVDPSRQTETYARATLEVDAERWRGVPVTIASGKAVGEPRQEIRIRFRPSARSADLPGVQDARPGMLRIGLQDEVIAIDANVGGEYDSRGLGRITLSSHVRQAPLTPYGSVVRGIFEGRRTFSVSGRAAEQGWRVLSEIRAAYDDGRAPLLEYPAGSAGPVPADESAGED